MQGVVHNIETECEKFEAAKTAGQVDRSGKPVKVTEEATVRQSDNFEAGATRGRKTLRHQQLQVRHQGHAKGRDIEGGDVRRSQGAEAERRTRNLGGATEASAEEPEDEEGLEPEEDEEDVREAGDHHEEVSPNEEVARNPERAGLRKTPKPSARKPLPRRPRTPSRSPPGYRQRHREGGKKWKGIKHVI